MPSVCGIHLVKFNIVALPSGEAVMSIEIVNLLLSAFGAVCLAGCLYIGMGWSL